MSVPIVVIHKGNQKYLHYCLLQAKRTNPNSRIILIGDESNHNCLDFVEHYNYKDLGCSQVEELSQNYKNFSPNSYDFELFCFLRWFYLRNLMKKLKLESCFHVDSDLMIYCDVDKECEKFEGAMLTIDSWDNKTATSPHNMYIGSFDAIDGFCNYVCDIYKNETKVSEFGAIYQERLANNYLQGISDMSLWIFFANILPPDKVYNLCGIIDGYKFDHNIIAEKDFEKNGYVKKIKFIKGIPYSKYISDGKYQGQLIEFKTLHFQGIAKCYMAEAYKHNRVTKFSMFKYKFGREVSRIFQKIS